MSVRQPIEQLQERARIVPAPVLRRKRGERTFELHPAIHLMLIGAYSSFVGILCMAFMGPDLIIPAAIVAISVVGLFLVPALWGRVAPDDGLRKQSWAEFMDEGVECITGRLTAGEAMAQILVLPALMIGLGVFMALVKATL